jgi:ubiquinol-cytochrome c reductase cytochrome c subunit
MNASPAETPAARRPARRRARGPQSKLRRRISSGARMIAALALVGSVYAAFAPAASAQDEPVLSPSATHGKQLFDDSCVSCHGLNGQGVLDRGPSLIGVGPAAVEFQVGTGRMPAARQEAQIEAKQPIFNAQETADLAAYVDALGGGPAVPAGTDFHTGADISAGGELFRVNCSSCHAFGGGGGALSSGKFAPSVGGASDRVIYAAMLSGPQNMPVFGDNQLTDQEKRDVIAYIQNLNSDTDPGGLGIGRLGPVTEGLVIFLVGIVGLVFATLWIAGKS